MAEKILKNDCPEQHDAESRKSKKEERKHLLIITVMLILLNGVSIY